MPCYDPQHGYRSKALTANGKRRIVFNAHTGYTDLPVVVPCGTCIGCRTDKAKEWAIRCAHEAQLHEHNAFLTLTYDDAHLPHVNDDPDEPLTLRKEDFVLFMKKLRKAREPQKLRFLQAAEYGKLGRPHHHALIFGLGFSDLRRWKKSGEYWLYRSEELETIWTYGYSSVGTVTIKSAMYVAQYALKKQFAKREQYGKIVPEYFTMSRNKGLGHDWLHQYGADVYPGDTITTSDGHVMKPPRYYDNILGEHHPEGLEKIKARRRAQLKEADQTGARLRDRNVCHIARNEFFGGKELP